MKNLSLQEKIEKIEEYLGLYGDTIKEKKLALMRKLVGDENDSCYTQAWDALSLLQDAENPYLGFRDVIEKNFGLDIDILEIGGGVYPSLSYSINSRQIEIGKGSITVYDPLLSKRLVSNGVILERKSFTADVDVSKFDLIISKEPCLATYAMLDAGGRTDKSMVLSPCKCYDLLPEDYYWSDLPTWYSFVYGRMGCSRSFDFKVMTRYLDEEYNYDNPIYIRKK